ncbi:YfhD family protein [Fictibacillus sp. Mic-4]|uniref:YfhD family protein n=1 Tax=Fictibacillus TaxID=1329200 RepID=UPI00041D1849|nr:YfhD family protein [Fictibacillus gelatini]
MGRAHKQRITRDKNKSSLPQVPRANLVSTDSENEFAKELDDRYEFEVKPGFGPTGVRRKDEDKC